MADSAHDHAKPGTRPGTPSAAPGTWRTLHLWQIQPVRDSLLIAAVIGVLYLGYLFKVATVPLLLGLVLAYLLEPLVGWLSARLRFTRPAAAVTLIGLMSLIVIVPTILAVAFSALQGVKLIQAMPEYWQRAEPHILELLAKLGVAADKDALRGTVAGWLQDNTQRATGAAAATFDSAYRIVLRALGASFYVAFMFFIVPFFFYFFSTAYPRVRHFIRQLIPDNQRERALFLLGRMDSVVSGFVRGRLVIAFILGVFHAIGWAICGVPAAMLVGLAAGLLSIIPFAIVLAWPVAIALLWLDQAAQPNPMIWWKVLLWPSVVYVLGQVLEGYVLTPIIQGKATNLDAATIVAAVLAGGSVAGLYGALLAIPVAACVRILIVEVIWPRFKDWTRGRAADPLPLSGDQPRP